MKEKKKKEKRKKKRILTKSSKPVRVPTISLSPFIITHKRDPIHLSISSVTNEKKKKKNEDNINNYPYLIK